MARKKADEPVPAHLEDLMTLLESQFSAILEGKMKPDRLAALSEVEAKHGISIDLDAEQREHPTFAERYQRWWRRLEIGLEDSAFGSALSGKGSATTILRGMGAMKGSGGGKSTAAASGRLVLERDHAARVDDFRRW